MLDEQLNKIREETNLNIIKGKKQVICFALINIVVALLSWLFSIYSFPLVCVSIILSIIIFFFSITKFLWFVNSLYRAYWYLAILFSMMNNGWEGLLGIISILILVFDIYSSICMLFSKSVEEYLYERKSKK